MTNFEKNAIWLNMIDILSYKKKIQLLNMFKDIEIRKNLNKLNIKLILNDSEYSKLTNMTDDYLFDKEVNSYLNKNIEIVTLGDDRYPKLLKEIPDPPICLYCKGNVSLLNTKCVAIVGTRKPTDYGVVTTRQYTKKLCEHGITIVSGLATGIDTIAHKEAINSEGNTIAVLAGGFNHIYPASNSYLARQICENNLLISENRPDCLPVGYLFPIRNRIIAGLSEAVLIPEAGLKSGTMHTKEFALQYNRDIFAIPGKINSPESQGTNAIIKDCQACMTLSPDDILESLHVDLQKNKENNCVQLDIRAQSVLDYIRTEKKTFQEIADFTNIKVNELNSLLSELEMLGLVTKLANNSYIML